VQASRSHLSSAYQNRVLPSRMGPVRETLTILFVILVLAVAAVYVSRDWRFREARAGLRILVLTHLFAAGVIALFALVLLLWSRTP
jgi:Zn-dependent protease with chaperone function